MLLTGRGPGAYTLDMMNDTNTTRTTAGRKVRLTAEQLKLRAQLEKLDLAWSRRLAENGGLGLPGTKDQGDR